MLVTTFIRECYLPARVEICDQYARKLYSVVGKFSAFLGHDAALPDFTEQNVGNYLTHYRKSWSARSTNNQRQVLLSLWIDAADNPKLAALISEQPRPKKIRKLQEDTEPPRCWRKYQIRQLVAHVQTLPGMVGNVPASIWWLSVRQVKLVGFNQLKGTGHGNCSCPMKSTRRAVGRPTVRSLGRWQCQP
jgi:hypothetical protein